MEIRTARMGDIDAWMELVRGVRESFPGLETEAALAEHRECVCSFIQRGGAICASESGALAGALLFSEADSVLCFLAVAEEHRREHIAQRMVELMLSRLDPTREVTVTTYREGAAEGAAARAFYRRMGFAEGRLGEEFGAPVQELVLHRRSSAQEDGALPKREAPCPGSAIC